MNQHAKIAVLHQSLAPPVLEGMRKPVKPGGCSDSGADIACALRGGGVSVITPAARPDPALDLDWVFPDTKDGIELALLAGASVLWANTILFSGHPLEDLHDRDVHIIGQQPAAVHEFDDKWHTNVVLASEGLPVAPAFLVFLNEVEGLTLETLTAHGCSLPCVVKPIRGHGSEGVTKVSTLDELKAATTALLGAPISVDGASKPKYGTGCMVEAYLPGQEITVTVMPPGTYQIDGRKHVIERCWCLPPVARCNHRNGIAPFSGMITVTSNSRLLDAAELADPQCRKALDACALAGEAVGARGPIRVDCRADWTGRFFLFDLNMKPNMTGAGRVGREAQDSLTAIAARAIGWRYLDLLLNMTRLAWPASFVLPHPKPADLPR